MFADRCPGFDLPGFTRVAVGDFVCVEECGGGISQGESGVVCVWAREEGMCDVVMVLRYRAFFMVGVALYAKCFVEGCLGVF